MAKQRRASVMVKRKNFISMCRLKRESDGCGEMCGERCLVSES